MFHLLWLQIAVHLLTLLLAAIAIAKTSVLGFVAEYFGSQNSGCIWI